MPEMLASIDAGPPCDGIDIGERCSRSAPRPWPRGCVSSRAGSPSPGRGASLNASRTAPTTGSSSASVPPGGRGSGSRARGSKRCRRRVRSIWPTGDGRRRSRGRTYLGDGSCSCRRGADGGGGMARRRACARRRASRPPRGSHVRVLAVALAAATAAVAWWTSTATIVGNLVSTGSWVDCASLDPGKSTAVHWYARKKRVFYHVLPIATAEGAGGISLDFGDVVPHNANASPDVFRVTGACQRTLTVAFSVEGAAAGLISTVRFAEDYSLTVDAGQTAASTSSSTCRRRRSGSIEARSSSRWTARPSATSCRCSSPSRLPRVAPCGPCSAPRHRPQRPPARSTRPPRRVLPRARYRPSRPGRHRRRDPHFRSSPDLPQH